MLNRGVFSANTDEWGTPQSLFDALNEEFAFDLDPCASRANHKCELYWTREDDGLSKNWAWLTAFVNPPYGREIEEWVYKAWMESRRNATVVCLLPARTDTGWWHRYCMRSSEIRFVEGRVQFVGSDHLGHNAPFPSAIVVFRPECQGPPKISSLKLERTV